LYRENLNPVFRKSFIRRVYDVLARHRSHSGTNAVSKEKLSASFFSSRSLSAVRIEMEY